jgi:hypothetical protein
MSYREFFSELPNRLSQLAGASSDLCIAGAYGGLKRVFEMQPAQESAPGPKARPVREQAKPRPLTQRGKNNPPTTTAAAREPYVEDPRRPLTIRDAHQGWGRKD